MRTLDQFQQWMDLYGKASEASDAEVAAALFSQDAEYHETPFGNPILGRDAIYRYWRDAAQHLKDVRFTYEILSMTGNRGVALWHATFTSVRSGKPAELDGVFLVEFDEQGNCRKFREWWHRHDADYGAIK